MKRLIAILCMCLLLTGCGIEYKDAKNVSKPVCGGYFTVIKEWNDNNGGVWRILYTNDTKVKYLMFIEGRHAGITPLYNTDGSLQVYEESEVEEEENETNDN